MNHFKNKDPLAHVVEKKIEGILRTVELHGLEPPGYQSACVDAAKDTIFFALLLIVVLNPESTYLSSHLSLFTTLAGFTIWKTGRSTYLGWARLERLHRLIAQEKYEIEHNQPQEREELMTLYATKGFSGDLLSQVVDVLMADPDRLLKVMLEEELGLHLSAYEHPLQQGLGALLGSGSITLIVLALLLLFPKEVTLFTLALFLFLGAAATAYLDRNKWLPTIIWTIALTLLALGSSLLLLKILQTV